MCPITYAKLNSNASAMRMHPNSSGKNWSRIGVIGGLGALASAHFLKLLVGICSQRYQAVQDSEYPYILLISLNSKGLDNEGAVDETILIPDMKQAFDLFKKQGVDVVAIPCNTVHAYLDCFPKNTHMKLVNLPQEIATSVSRLQVKEAEILCCRGLKNTRAYDSYFLAKGIRLHYPSKSVQDLVDELIVKVITGNHSTQTGTDLLDEVNSLRLQREAVVLACSELSVLVDSRTLPANVIDSMCILAESTLKLASRDH